MTHSQFKLILAPYEVIKKQYEEDINILEQALEKNKTMIMLCDIL